MEADFTARKMPNIYRMTDQDITLMIQLRATNAAIFTGRRNSAMSGWRAIRKEMNLKGFLDARQLKKKWDNMKEKYKTLKNPPAGMETVTQPSSWRWFQLMDEAMTGRLAGTANIVQPSLQDEDEEHKGALPALILHSMGGDFSELDGDETVSLEGVGTLREVPELSGTESPQEIVTDVMETQTAINKNQTAELYVTLLPDCTAETQSSSPNINSKLDELQRERWALQREQSEFDTEMISLERDRELLNRDMVTLERDRVAVERDRVAVERDRVAVERDRAAVERDRAAVERDRVILDRDRAFLDRDRAFIERDRVLLERDREDLERERALLRRERDGNQTEMTTEKEVLIETRLYQSLIAAGLDPDQLETRERLVSLFQKLVEKL